MAFLYALSLEAAIIMVIRMVWILMAFGAALATSLTNVLAKIGIKDINSDFATAYRTFVVLVAAALFCVATGSFLSFPSLDWKNYLFLALSGLATGFSWLCYYKALQLGNINQVAPIDKSSFILSSILFLIFFFDDTTKGGDPLTIGMLFLSMALMLIGTLLMIERKKDVLRKEGNRWVLFAFFSAVFAALTSFFVKLGLQGTSSSLGTFLRTGVVLAFSLLIVFSRHEFPKLKTITKRNWIFLTLSGLATGIAWFLEYAALNYQGSNPVAITSIEKFSIALTMLFSFFILKEKFTKKMLLGLLLLLSAIGVMVAFAL